MIHCTLSLETFILSLIFVIQHDLFILTDRRISQVVGIIFFGYSSVLTNKLLLSGLVLFDVPRGYLNELFGPTVVNCNEPWQLPHLGSLPFI